MLNFRITPGQSAVEKDKVREVQVQAQQANTENQRLKENVHRLTIIVQALWEITKTKSGLTDEDLKKAMREVEIARAKAFTEVGKCKSCSRPVSVQSKMCAFCGEKVEDDSIFPKNTCA